MKKSPLSHHVHFDIVSLLCSHKMNVRKAARSGLERRSWFKLCLIAFYLLLTQ